MADTHTIFEEEFLAKYADFPKHMTPLGMFVFLRTYSRFLTKEKRRETYKETCLRATQYNIQLVINHLLSIGYSIDWKQIRQEAQLLFDNMFNMRQFLSGRTLWIGGTQAATRCCLSNFNCAALNITKWDDFCDLFYLLMVGTGVGFKSNQQLITQMAKIRNNTKLIHSDYHPLPKKERLETTQLTVLPNGFAKIYVGDSKEGWVESLRKYLQLLTQAEYEYIHTIKISYNSVRPRGERLRTFGGTSSGPEPLREMFAGIDLTLKGTLDHWLDPLVADSHGYVRVRPVHIMDIGNLIGQNVVIGGVRRTAEMVLFEENDYEILFAKYGINGFYTDEQYQQHLHLSQELDKIGIKPRWFDQLTEMYQKDGHARREGLDHRHMSNNSILFQKRPSLDYLKVLLQILRYDGEPGLINMEEMKRRRPNAELVNPCGEVILDSCQTCNLTTVNLMQFIGTNSEGQKILDREGLDQAQKMSVRAGLRMTLVTLELPVWDQKQKRDRLIGTSLTGIKDAMDYLGYTSKQEMKLIGHLGRVARREAVRYAKEIRVTAPLLVTTIKPEGSLSQLAGGVSQGLHLSHSPYFIRRIRINSHDPMVSVIKEVGWPIHPEVGTAGATEEERMTNARTYVIDFPVASHAKKTKYQTTVEEQLETYFTYQKIYADHNCSNTISVKPEEWEKLPQMIYDHWDQYLGITFIPLDGGNYELAPFEECSAQAYQHLKDHMKQFDMKLLEQFDRQQMTSADTAENETEESVTIPTDATMTSGCANGVCPLR